LKIRKPFSPIHFVTTMRKFSSGHRIRRPWKEKTKRVIARLIGRKAENDFG
jgi:hypothetical protein